MRTLLFLLTLTPIGFICGCTSEPIQVTCREIEYGGGLMHAELLGMGRIEPSPSFATVTIDTTDPAGAWRRLELILCDGTHLRLVDANLVWCEERLAEWWQKLEMAAEAGTWCHPPADWFRDEQGPELRYIIFGRFTLTFTAGKLSKVALNRSWDSGGCDDARLIDTDRGESFSIPPQLEELKRVYGEPTLVREEVEEL